jgi:hypothetical protein
MRKTKTAKRRNQKPAPTIIDRRILERLEGDIVFALRDIAKTYNVTFTCPRAKFTDTQATIQLAAVVNNPDGTKNTPYAAEFNRYYKLFRFDKKDLGRTFRRDGYEYEFLGLIPGKRKKYPCVVKKLANGKLFKFTVEGVQDGLRYEAHRGK